MVLLAVVTILGATLVMVLGNNTTVHLGRAAAVLQGEAYEGSRGTHATAARTRPQTLRNFDDARLRQDQYSRPNEPKRSRKNHE